MPLQRGQQRRQRGPVDPLNTPHIEQRSAHGRAGAACGNKGVHLPLLQQHLPPDHGGILFRPDGPQRILAGLNDRGAILQRHPRILPAGERRYHRFTPAQQRDLHLRMTLQRKQGALDNRSGRVIPAHGVYGNSHLLHLFP